MKILYQAEDGKIFEDEDKCYGYEYALKFPEMFNIWFYDEEGSLFHIDKNNIFSDDVYFRAEKVYVHDEMELTTLHILAVDCGWCEFDQITEPGIWLRTESTESFIGGKWNKIEVNDNVG